MPDSAQIKALLAKANALLYRDPATGQRFTALALEIAERPGNKAMMPKVVNQRGTLHWVVGEYEQALEDYRTSEGIFRELDDSLGMARVQNNIGLVYMDMSYYDLSLPYFLKSLAYFELHPQPYSLATLYNNIGSVIMGNGDSVTAEKYFQKAIPKFEEVKDTGGLCMVHNNLGLSMDEGARLDEAMGHFMQALKGYQALGYLLGQAKVLTNIGSVYVKQGKWAEAEAAHRRALAIGEETGSVTEIAIPRLKLAEMFLKMGRYEEAITEARAALAINDTVGALLPTASTHEVLAFAFEKSHQYDSALVHFKAFSSLSDSIFNEAKARSLSEMRLKFESELKDKALQNLEQEKRLDRLTNVALGGLVALLIVVGLLIYLRQRAIIRREQALAAKTQEVARTQQALSEAERKTAEVERLRLQEELSYKVREIANLAMNIVRRNDLLEVMDRELKALRKGVDEQKLKDLSLLVSQTLSLENERKEFQIYIQEAQQNFFRNLETKYPDLSTKEKRLCAMIKLGLSSKEIAAVFNIEIGSVEVARHRLRKKLDLDPQVGLKEFFDGF
ncbi:MAG: tetratricopeptide repeat protein [Bacteroidia bacterium]